MDDEDDDAEQEVHISLDEAIAIARRFLRGKFGEGDYELVESETKNHEYELVFRLDGIMFEVEVDAEDGEIDDYEARFEELTTEIEEEEDDEVEVRALDRERERSYHVTIAKNSTVVTLGYAVQEEAVPDLSSAVRFMSLIEYLDTGITPHVYDDGDFVVNEIVLSSLMWNVSSAELQNKVIVVEQSSVVGPADRISLVYRASPLYSARVNGTMWRVKIEIQIDGFRWQRPLGYPAPNLALAIQLEPPFELDLENGIVRFTEVEGVAPYFSWGGALTVDGSPATLNVSAGQNLLYLSYPHFDVLTHDPK
ncbi:MAG: PepSY domain-containing protein [Candidatus Geothermarchaeales archaeon]